MVELELSIKKSFKTALRPLHEEERKQLEAKIVADGRVREPILYWHHDGKNWIVDGMHRYEIATKHGIPFRTEPLTFADEKAVTRWILENQLGKRNLNPDDAKLLRGKLYNDLKRDDGGHGDQRSDCQIDRPITEHAAKHVANLSGVSKETVQRDGKFVAQMESLSEPLRKVIEASESLPAAALMAKLAKLDHAAQSQIARDVRVHGKSLKDASKGYGVRSGEEEAPGTEQPQETSNRPPRTTGKERKPAPVDLGRCPNCAGTKFDDRDGNGLACSKCHHPWGTETGGDVDEDRVSTKRLKTIKTAEALMREFDDLNLLCAKPKEHANAIATCKILLKTAKDWT